VFRLQGLRVRLSARQILQSCFRLWPAANSSLSLLARPSHSHSSSTIHLLAHLYFHSILPRSSPLLYPLAPACIGGQVQRVCGSWIPLYTDGGSRFKRTADPVLHPAADPVLHPAADPILHRRRIRFAHTARCAALRRPAGGRRALRGSRSG
jgi:hypothetical protein